MNPLITTLKNARLFMRSTALLVVFTHTFLILSPAAAAVRDELGKPNKPERSAEAALSAAYANAIEKLVLLKQLREHHQDSDEVLDDLASLKSRIVELDKTVSENFIIEKESLDSKQLPETILKRHSCIFA